jgi:hypothetical protein
MGFFNVLVLLVPKIVILNNIIMSLSYYYPGGGEVNFVFNKFYFLHSDIQDQ